MIDPLHLRLVYAACALALGWLTAGGAAAQAGADDAEPTVSEPTVSEPTDDDDELENAAPRAEPPAEPPTATMPPYERAMGEFAELDTFIGVASGRADWTLDDGVGTPQVPWDDYDPEYAYGPRGNVHLGITARLAAMPGGGVGLPAPDGPYIEAGGLLDIRYAQDRPWRLRLGVAVNYQPYAQENLGAGSHVSQSPFALRFRIQPLAVDLGHWISLRLGADLGMQWAPGYATDGGAMAFLFAAHGEVALLLLEGVFEIGLFGGLQMTAVGRSTRSGFGTDLRPEGMIGISGAMLFE
ncbi:MAG: hypothetical protein AB7S26_28445 [Sandaracinaceae bacterium]